MDKLIKQALEKDIAIFFKYLNLGGDDYEICIKCNKSYLNLKINIANIKINEYVEIGYDYFLQKIGANKPSTYSILYSTYKTPNGYNIYDTDTNSPTMNKLITKVKKIERNYKLNKLLDG